LLIAKISLNYPISKNWRKVSILFAEVPLSSQFWQLQILAITNSHRPLRIGELLPTEVTLVPHTVTRGKSLNPLRIGELLPENQPLAISP